MKTRLRLRWRLGRRGGSESVSAVILVPLFLLLIFLVVQVGMFWHANNVAHSAASAAYNEARLDGAGRSDGEAAANQVLSRSEGSVRQPKVSVSRTAERAVAAVSGRGPSLVPFWDGPTIHQEVSGPTERWIGR